MLKNRKIVFVASVYEELSSLLLKSEERIKIIDRNAYTLKGSENIYFLITGVGVLNTNFYLTLLLEKIKPDLIVQVGIGGAFKVSNIKIGDIIFAEKEINIDFGLENREEVVSEPIFNDRTYKTDKKVCNFIKNSLKKKYGDIKSGVFITSSTITTSKKRHNVLKEKFDALVENMEGFSSLYCAKLFNIPFVEIRSISNFVRERDKKMWNKEVAFKNINGVVQEIVEEVRKKNRKL